MTSKKDKIRTELLFLRFRRGDTAALKELIGLWERPLFYYIRRLVETEEDAWDALQEVWAIVIRKAHQLRDPEAVIGWLYKIARNAAISYMRKNPTFVSLEGDNEIPESTADTTDFTSQYEAEELHWGLNQLTLAHREVLTLHFLEGFLLAEIAEIVGTSVGTVKSRMHYAKKALREVLEKEAQHRERT